VGGDKLDSTTVVTDLNQFKPVSSELFPLVTVPTPKTGREDFNGDVQVTLTLELVGDGTNELSIKLGMKATDNTITMEGTRTVSLLKAPAGKRLYLPPDYPLKDTLNYTAKDEKGVLLRPTGQNNTTIINPIALAIFTPNNFFDPNVPPVRLAMLCACLAKVPGPDETKVGAGFMLVPIPFMVEIP
jgi:hypothetical protein